MPKQESVPNPLAADQALQRLHEAARQAGFECLASTWRGWHARCQFRCAQGHAWTLLASSVVFYPSVCQQCVRQQRLERLQQAAQAQGGQCLEHTYLGEMPHRFVCALGHAWKARPSHILNDHSWCRQCAHIANGQRRLQQDGLERLQRLAAEKGGTCLSETYTGGTARYRFICAQGHRWDTEGNNVVSGAWCRQCAYDDKRKHYRLSDGLERLQRAANAKGGVCLAQQYVLSKSFYRFRCQQGHEWEATGHRVLRGGWCPQCVYDSKKLGIEVMHQIAEKQGGRCLSAHYANRATKLHWECDRGHRWHAVPATIRKGHWCPDCASMNRISNRKSTARMKYVRAEHGR